MRLEVVMLDSETLQKISVMVINQDRSVQDKLRNLVSSFGIERITCVDSYEEAFELACIQKNRYDLVISNMCLGHDAGYTGIDICRRIKIEDPRTLCLIASEEYSDTDLIELLSCNIDGIIDRKNMLKIMTKWISVLTKKKMLQGLIQAGLVA